MKKYLKAFIAAFLAAASVSCTKDVAELPSAGEGIKVSFKARIDNPTKTTYEAVDGALKTMWEDGDKVSVLTLAKNAEGEEIFAANDIFTNTAGAGREAVFEGTLSEVEGDVRRVVFYPAMDYKEVYEHDVYDEDWNVIGREEDVYFYDMFDDGSQGIGIRLNDSGIHLLDAVSVSQERMLSDLKHFDLMSGALVVAEDSSLETTLAKIFGVLKVEIELDGPVVFPEDDDLALRIGTDQRTFANGLSNDYHISFTEEGYGSVETSTDIYDELGLRDILEYSIEPDYVVDNKLKAYLMIPVEFTLEKGCEISLELGSDNSFYPMMEKHVTLSQDLVFRKGEINTLRASLKKSPGLEPVDLGLSVKWGSRFFGRDVYWGSDDFFSYENRFNEGGKYTKYNSKDGLKKLQPEDDTATILLGGPWRMPTLAEFEELLDPENTTITYRTIPGYLHRPMIFTITSRKPGFEGASITLIARTGYEDTPIIGCWTSEKGSDDDTAFAVYIGAKNSVELDSRDLWFFILPVYPE